MKSAGFLLLSFVLVVVSAAGCGKKQEALEELQQPMAPEDLSRLRSEALMSEELKAQSAAALQQNQTAAVAVSAAAPAAAKEVKLEPLPASGPYGPSSQEIQKALKNAGYYPGKIDGKIGPVSKKSIEAFQKDNGLKVDGKVGPKTWSVLSKYLDVPAPEGLPIQSTLEKN